MNDPIDAVENAIRGRSSVRAFRPDPVPAALVRHLLDVAARAPSGTNMQPWRVYALAGDAKAALSRALLAAAGGPLKSEYKYYPDPFFEPYLTRRRKVGWDLYGLLGIERGDSERMRAQHDRNLVFFDAPVGLLFTIERRLEIGSWLDYGMFLENIMVAARAHGLETCVQAAFAPFHSTIHEALGLTEGEIVVCGMSLGYPDVEAVVNTLVTEREAASDFTTFLGWPDEGPAGS